MSMSSNISKEDIEVLKDLKNAILRNDIRITCIGLYNSGKSSLLNSLIDDIEHKTFKVSDTRETTQNKAITIENITFVDTPGLNAQEHDDKKVMDAIKESDLNLFVHNINTGEIQGKEYEFLETIAQNWSHPLEFIQKTVFVLTKVDEMGNKKDIAATKERIKDQIKELLKTDIEVVCVSSRDYADGKKENEQELIGQSNILALKNIIETLAKKFQHHFRETREKRLERKTEQLIKSLSTEMERKRVLLTLLQLEQKNLEEALSKDLQEINATLEQKYMKLKEVKYGMV